MNIKDRDTHDADLEDRLGSGDHVVNLNGVDLHYHICGSGPLVFLVSPGWGIGSGYLQRGLAFLQDSFRLAFVDTRGSGLSGRPADHTKMSSADMADDLEALRQHLGLSDIQLVGHSNAGAIALSYAQRYQDHITKLVLIDAQVLGFGASEVTQAILMARAEDPRYEVAVRAAVEQFSGRGKPLANDADVSAFVAAVLPLYLQKPERNLALAQEQLLVGGIAFYAFQAQKAADRATGTDQASLLDRICASTLIMSGRYDWICPLPIAERLHAGIRRSRLIVFEESGHMPWIEEPARFATELIPFLQG